MPTVQYGVNVSAGSIAINRNIVRTADHLAEYEVEVAAANSDNAGTLTTRTDADTGTATLGASHTITTGAIVDIYWDGGVRYGVTVGTVAGTSVPFGAAAGEGSGDDLPAATTAITMVTRTQINTNIDGDASKIVAISMESTDSSSTTNGHIDMQDSGSASIEPLKLDANVSRVWDIEGGDTNVFTGNPITTSFVSHNSTTEVVTFKIVSLEDSTP